MTRHVVLVVLAALLAGGCGADDEQDVLPPAQAAQGTDLTVEVHPEGPAGPAREDRLRCPGDDRCERLDPEAFEPVPPDVACTEIYGGPSTARVTGELDGKPIDASFSRSNGCEIARWDKLEWLLGRVEGPKPPGFDTEPSPDGGG
jgi:hypothetical protein